MMKMNKEKNTALQSTNDSLLKQIVRSRAANRDGDRTNVALSLDPLLCLILNQINFSTQLGFKFELDVPPEKGSSNNVN